jgi:MscS family membrane protein
MFAPARVEPCAPPALRAVARAIVLAAAVLPALVMPALASRAWAQSAAPAAPAAPAPAPAPKTVAPDSPRASLQRYLDLCRAGRFAEAAEYLQVPPARAKDAALLAERLKAVLDRHIWFDPERISGASEGSTDDGLPPGTEEIGRVPGPGGIDEALRMVRVAEGTDHARWAFSEATVARIDGWYDRLGDRWLREHLPEPLLRPGPRELLWWQWMALPLVFFVAWMFGHLLSWLTRRVLGVAFSRTSTQWDDVLLQKMGGPLTLLWALAVAFLLLPLLVLYAPAEAFIHRVLRAGFFVTFFWALLRTVDVAAQFLSTSSWGQSHKAVGAFIPLGVRIAKVVVAAMAAIAILSELGYPVASLIAGLGIGGLALALAAQKTVENLFGSVSLGVDQPIRVGDFVKIEDFVGTVESIGLRSSRIRTLDRTVVSIPNGKLADMRLETFAARDRIRFFATLGLVYGTTEDQMRTVVRRFDEVLRTHPKVWPESIRVVFVAFGDHALTIECLCWFETADWNEFNFIRQDVLLRFMKIVEETGTSFAFPTRTVHLVQSPEARR